MKQLTDKQQRFCDEYLANGMNATQAAISAGYSKKTARQIGEQNLSKLDIQQYLQSKQKKTADKLEMSFERLATEYARVGFSDVRRLYRPDGTLKTPDEWDDDIAAAVSAVETTEVKDKKGKVTTRTHKVRMLSKTPALSDMGKHLGFFEKDNEQKKPEVYDFTGLSASDKLQLLKILSKAGKK